MMALANTQPAPPRALNADIPQALSDFIMKLLEKKPEERPPTALTVAQTLDKILQPDDKSQETTVKLPPPTSGPGRSRSRFVFLTATCLLLLAVVGVPLGQQIYLRIIRDGKEQDIELKPGDILRIVEKKPEKQAPIVAGKPLPDKDKPFVILRQGGDKKDEFKHFQLAISQLEKGMSSKCTATARSK